jgi:hypothetical protein
MLEIICSKVEATLLKTHERGGRVEAVAEK